MFGQVPPVLTEAAAISGALVVIVTSLGILSRLRFVRWLWSRNIADPLGRWVDKWGTSIIRGWHDKHVEPRLTLLEVDVRVVKEDVSVARAWAEVLAERQGIPTDGVDPTELLARSRAERP